MLSTEQRIAPAAIAASESIWRFHINTAEILRAFGLPDSRTGPRLPLSDEPT
jgi:hypothetical protein